MTTITCHCTAYGFGHRPGSGKCEAMDKSVLCLECGEWTYYHKYTRNNVVYVGTDCCRGDFYTPGFHPNGHEQAMLDNLRETV